MPKREIIEVAAVIIFTVFLVWLLFLLPKHGEVVYNCTWAEISPDIPPKIKEECRKRNMVKIK